MWKWKFALVCSVLVGIAGCGKPPMLSVGGTVKLDGVAVADCKVGFFPDTSKFDPDRHGFGFGVTDKEGKFTIQHPQGEKGIYPGKYKVTFVLWVDNKGKVMPMDTKPSEVEGGVFNRFPAKYEAPHTTTETVSVANAENNFEFNIASK